MQEFVYSTKSVQEFVYSTKSIQLGLPDKRNTLGAHSFLFELPDTRHDVAIALLSRPGAQQPRPPLADTAEAEDRRARVTETARCFGAPSV